jgi:hypothetical protein
MDASKRTTAEVTTRSLSAAALYSFVTGVGTAAGAAVIAWIVWLLQSC